MPIPFRVSLREPNTLAAVKEGSRLSDAAGVILSQGTTIEINPVCTAEASLTLGAIAGVLTVTDASGTAVPLAGGKITLQNNLGQTVAVTYTAEDGEFAFYGLADGICTLLSSAEGYQSVSAMTTVIANGSISNVTMAMTIDTRTYNGTVSGIIRNKAGQAVAGCFVGLYRVDNIAGIRKETLIAVTKTNSAGKYLFGSVVSGEYLVKAKLEQ